MRVSAAVSDLTPANGPVVGVLLPAVTYVRERSPEMTDIESSFNREVHKARTSLARIYHARYGLHTAHQRLDNVLRSALGHLLPTESQGDHAPTPYLDRLIDTAIHFDFMAHSSNYDVQVIMCNDEDGRINGFPLKARRKGKMQPPMRNVEDSDAKDGTTVDLIVAPQLKIYGQVVGEPRLRNLEDYSWRELGPGSTEHIMDCFSKCHAMVPLRVSAGRTFHAIA
jgi:hypothetical protein